MSSKAVSPNPAQHYLWYILAVALALTPGTTTLAENNGGGGIFYPVAEATTLTPNNNNNTSCCAERAQRAVMLREALRSKVKSQYPHVTPQPTANAAPTQNNNVMLRAAEQPRSTHSLPQYSTANAVPDADNSVLSATQALDTLERKLEQRLRVAATNFANNTAQGFVQQSLPQRLLGGHWLREKFQFLSTLAWQSGDDKGGILGELDLVVPLYGKRNAAGVDQYGFFVQPGLVSWEADNGDRRLDMNVGLVYRHRIRERIAVGAAVFYDHNIDSDLKRIGAAADWVSPYTYVAVNYYEPISGWRTGERLGYEERALRGVDVNIEQALWDSQWVLEASGGYWKGYDADNRQGEWQLAGSMGIRFYPLDYLSVYADYAYHHQDVDTDHFAAGIEFSYPGKHRGISENEIDLWRPVKREKRILYAEREALPTRIMVSASSESIAISAGEYTPEQLQLTVAIDRALAADLQLRFALLVNGVAESAQRLKDGGMIRVERGQTQAVITYSSTDLGQLFGNASIGDRYVLQLKSAVLKLPGRDEDVSFAIAPMGSGGQVMITVGAAGSASTTTPTLTLARDPADIAGGGAISLLVTSDVAITGSLTLPLTISGQVAAGDFAGGLMQSVSANFNGSTTATVTIATVKDTDAMESYTIMLGSGAGYMVGSDNTAAGRITMALPILTLATDPSAVRSGSNISLVITSDVTIAGTLTLPLRISNRLLSGIGASDFTGGLNQSASANFNGSRTATVMIGTRGSAADVKTYTITLGSGAGYMVGSDNTATGFIKLNVALPFLALETPVAVTAGDDISVVITSDIVVAGSVTLRLLVVNTDVVGNLLPNGITASDVDSPVGIVIRSVSADFNGSRTATVTIGTVRDADATAEIYRIILQGFSSDYTVINPTSVIGTINPNP